MDADEFDGLDGLYANPIGDSRGRLSLSGHPKHPSLATRSSRAVTKPKASWLRYEPGAFGRRRCLGLGAAD